MEYFRCKKCFFQFVAAPGVAKTIMRCGAVKGWDYDEETGEEIPIGCGGEVKAVTEQEAFEYAEHTR